MLGSLAIASSVIAPHYRECGGTTTGVIYRLNAY